MKGKQIWPVRNMALTYIHTYVYIHVDIDIEKDIKVSKRNKEQEVNI